MNGPENANSGAAPDSTGPVPSQEARNMAMLCHLLGIFTGFIGPLILWLIKKDQDAYVNSQGKEALNFQITVAIAGVISGVLTVICIGVILAVVVMIGDLVFAIMACLAANKGQDYRYPVSIRFIK